MNQDIVNVLINLLKELNISKVEFSKLCGLNRGMIADVLNRKKPLSFIAYVTITDSLNIPIERYLQEYLLGTLAVTNHPLKVTTNILKKCIEISRIDIALQALSYHLEYSINNNIEIRVFDIAEELYKDFKYEAAKSLYLFIVDSLIENTNLDKTILGISYYRLFTIRQNQKLKNEDYALLTRLNLVHLPRNMRLNALYNLCLFFLIESPDWVVLESLTQQMISLVNELIEVQKIISIPDEKDEKLTHPLVRYYGQGYLMQSSSFRNQKHYQKAYELINNYENLEWFPILDEEGLQHVDRFKVYAEGNKYVLQLRMGNLTVSSDYMNFLSFNPDEFLPGIVAMLECANEINENLNSRIIDKAIELIILRDDIVYHHPYYNQKKQQAEYMKLIHQTSVYLIRTNQRDIGIDITLKFLENAILFRNNDMIVFAMSILETNKRISTKDQIQTYDKIRGSMSNYEKTYQIDSNSA